MPEAACRVYLRAHVPLLWSPWLPWAPLGAAHKASLARALQLLQPLSCFSRPHGLTAPCAAPELLWVSHTHIPPGSRHWPSPGCLGHSLCIPTAPGARATLWRVWVFHCFISEIAKVIECFPVGVQEARASVRTGLRPPLTSYWVCNLTKILSPL